MINPNKALWEKGDFTRIAAAMRDSGDELVESLGVAPGMDVLDLGCGDGTTALPAAKRGANVLGVDIAANLVAAGNARATAAGLHNLRFQEGDASDLRGSRGDGPRAPTRMIAHGSSRSWAHWRSTSSIRRLFRQSR